MGARPAHLSTVSRLHLYLGCLSAVGELSATDTGDTPLDGFAKELCYGPDYWDHTLGPRPPGLVSELNAAVREHFSAKGLLHLGARGGGKASPPPAATPSPARR